jgi:GDP/UDP-N,N'-diacetylbacillosamine 2-epimerase (hydrolysing)
LNRKICYVTGTRADFGLMRSTLKAILADEQLSLSLIVTGTHLSGRFGNTVDEVQAASIPIAAVIELDLSQSTGEAMARNIGRMLDRMAATFAEIRPDVVLLLGDRGEMIAGALAAIHLNIPIVHIHGGERSGTIDEPIRHAISKLAHFHLVATETAKSRLIRMGENSQHIEVVGAPGLDGLTDTELLDKRTLFGGVGFSADRACALMVYHPVVQEEGLSSGSFISKLLVLLARRDIQVVAIRPNSDAGSETIRNALDERSQEPSLRVVTHFPRDQFVSWVAAADFMIGNSSSGIIEAATFGTPVINIGSRQHLRERNHNVVDVALSVEAIGNAIEGVLKHGRYDRSNIYGDGQAGARIVSFLKNLILDRAILAKQNGY